MSNYIKDRLAWLRSFFTASPVLTGKGFTTGDESLKETKVPKGRRPGIVRYASQGGHVFLLVGQDLINGRVMYRVYDDTNEKEHILGKELFDLLFRIQLEGNP